jgi:type II secretory pathway pseudopilin PulG
VAPHRGRATRAAGFTYVGVLIAIALAGLALAGTGRVWSTVAQREREAELLFVGDQYRRAIASYFDASPGAKEYPRSLAELLEDRRQPITRRHLRRLYADPMAPEAPWGLVRIGDRIQGVYSSSTAVPIKRAGFGPNDAAFASAASYRDWRFVAQPAGSARPDQAAPAASAVEGAEFPGLGGAPREPTTLARPEPAPAPDACDDSRARDVAVCAQLPLDRAGERARCMAAASQRFAICRRSGERAMPPLVAPKAER